MYRARVPIQISGKEEIRISRAITRCKHKKIFLENIKSVITMRVRVGKILINRVQKILDSTGSTVGSVSSAVLWVDWLCSLASCVGYFYCIFFDKAEFLELLKSSVFTKFRHC
jgi:hypothetical protein